LRFGLFSLNFWGMTQTSAAAAAAPAPHTLLPALKKLAGAPVLCIGDVMLDRFIYGDVVRISPEAPVPILRITRDSAMLGGAGNVIRNLSDLGAATTFLTVVGNDAAGREVTTLSGDVKGCDPHILIDKNRMTTVKTRFVSGMQQLLRADEETTAALKPQTATQLQSLAESYLPHVGVVILSDYGKGVLTPDSVRALITAARTLQKIVLIDPKGRDYTHYRGASLLTPNRKELAEATGLPVTTDDDIVAAAEHLIETIGVDAVLATRGHEGMSLIRSDAPPLHVPAEAQEVYDVSGAGDTVIATIAAALAGGIGLEDAVRLGNVAAGIVVGKVGTATIHPNELEAALRADSAAEHTGKIATLQQAKDQRDRWRRQNLTVGFTNGCFDLIHPGHISSLTAAAGKVDRLIVGLNSDASVKRLKGETRPVQTEDARAIVLSSLTMVDQVIIFEDDTPLALIEALQPDVLFKGADYTRATVIGADIVEKAGGRVELLPLVEGQSTTNTIRKIGQAG
jgi:D-beta-D-heptose 7-phosphate kinase / D-beta-D-heptose 1-phosphate adenosyltransferase